MGSRIDHGFDSETGPPFRTERPAVGTSAESPYYRGSVQEWRDIRAWGQRLIGEGPDETAIALTALGDVDLYVRLIAEWRPGAA